MTHWEKIQELQEVIESMAETNRVLLNRLAKMKDEVAEYALADKNLPLLVDELQELDNEPVYTIDMSGRGEWWFRRNGGFTDMYGNWDSDEDMAWGNYGRLWWAYRNKPKGG